MLESFRSRFAAAIEESYGAKVPVVEYAGDFDKEAIERISKKLPAVFVSVTRFAPGTKDRIEPTIMVGMLASVLAAHKPLRGAALNSRAARTAYAIALPIWRELLTNARASSSDAWSYPDMQVGGNHSGDMGPMGQGFGLISIPFEVELSLPAETDAATLQDLQTVNWDLDFADLAPDGSTPPDGVVDHTGQAQGLDT